MGHWDGLLLTAGNAKQKKAFELQLNAIEGLRDSVRELHVLEDLPVGEKIGGWAGSRSFIETQRPLNLRFRRCDAQRLPAPVPTIRGGMVPREAGPHHPQWGLQPAPAPRLRHGEAVHAHARREDAAGVEARQL